MLDSMRMGRADMMFALLVLSLDFFDCYSYGAPEGTTPSPNAIHDYVNPTEYGYKRTHIWK